MNILFVTATRIGDAVLSTGLLSHLIDRYLDANITVAAGPLAAPPVRGRARRGRARRHDGEARGGIVLGDAAWRGREAPVGYGRRSAGARRSLGCCGHGSARSRHAAITMCIACGSSAHCSHSTPPPSPRLWARRGNTGEMPRRWCRRANRWSPSGRRPTGAASSGAATGLPNWRGAGWSAPGGVFAGSRVAVMAAEHERPQAEALLAAPPPGHDRSGRAHGAADRGGSHRGGADVHRQRHGGYAHRRCRRYADARPVRAESCDPLRAVWGRCTAIVQTEIPAEAMWQSGFDHRTTETLMDSLSVERVEEAVRALRHRAADAAA